MPLSCQDRIGSRDCKERKKLDENIISCKKWGTCTSIHNKWLSCYLV